MINEMKIGKVDYFYMVISPLYRTLTDSLIKGYYIHCAFLLSLVKLSIIVN